MQRESVCWCTVSIKSDYQTGYVAYLSEIIGGIRCNSGQLHSFVRSEDDALVPRRINIGTEKIDDFVTRQS